MVVKNNRFRFLPIGYRFGPDDEAVVEVYLINRVLGRPLYYHEIYYHIDIYLHDPEDLPIDISGSSKMWGYFFVKGAGPGTDRRTPSGYWKAIAEEELFGKDGRRIIGYKEEFVFYRGNGPDGVETKWMMNEYRLNPEIEELKNPIVPKMENCVVCMIYKEKDEIQLEEHFEDDISEESEELEENNEDN